jgi:uncharacterized protein
MNKKVPNKAQILKTLKLHKADLEKYGVKRVGLFGSFVSGRQKPKSDIDLIVEFDRDCFGRDFHGLFDSYLQLTEYLEKLLGRKVDILTPAGVDSIRIKEIAEEIKRSTAYV